MSPKKPEVRFSRYYLPNGLKCIFYKRPEVHSVNISVVVNAGVLDEKKENNGVFHFIEHLPFDGTKELPDWVKVNDFLNEISGSSNAYTSFDHTRYYGTFPHQYLEESVYYLSQLVLHPLHKEEDIDKERDIIIDEMKRYEDSIGHKIYRNMIENRFTTRDSSFVFDIAGTEENLKRFKQKDIVKDFNEYYTPENMEIYVVGNFEIPKVKKLIKKYFYDDIKSTNYAKKPDRYFHKVYPEYSQFNINTAQKLDINQYYLTISFPCYEFALTPQIQRHLLGFVSAITASSQYQNSILWMRLREELGIVYGVNCWTHSMYNRALIAVETSFNPEYLETVMKEIHSGIETVLSGTFAEDIFNSRQKRIMDTEMMRYDNPSNVLSWIVEQEDELAVHGENITISQYIEMVKNYSFDDVIKTARETFDWNRANITVVSQNNAEELQTEVNKIWNSLKK